MKIVTTREDPGQINNLADVSDQPADGTSVRTGAVPGATLSRALPRLCKKKRTATSTARRDLSIRAFPISEIRSLAQVSRPGEPRYPQRARPRTPGEIAA